MKPEEFVFWLKGFVTASNHYNLTPAAWDELKAQLQKVQLSEDEDDYLGDDALLD